MSPEKLLRLTIKRDESSVLISQIVSFLKRQAGPKYMNFGPEARSHRTDAHSQWGCSSQGQFYGLQGQGHRTNSLHENQ